MITSLVLTTNQHSPNLQTGGTNSLPNIHVHVLNHTSELLLQTYPLWVGGVRSLIDHTMAVRIHKVGQENVASTQVLVKEIVEHINLFCTPKSSIK